MKEIRALLTDKSIMHEFQQIEKVYDVVPYFVLTNGQ